MPYKKQVSEGDYTSVGHPTLQDGDVLVAKRGGRDCTPVGSHWGVLSIRRRGSGAIQVELLSEHGDAHDFFVHAMGALSAECPVLLDADGNSVPFRRVTKKRGK